MEDEPDPVPAIPFPGVEVRPVDIAIEQCRLQNPQPAKRLIIVHDEIERARRNVAMEFIPALNRGSNMLSVSLLNAGKVEQVQAHAGTAVGLAGKATMLSAPNQAVSCAIAVALSTCVNKIARRILGREHAT